MAFCTSADCEISSVGNPRTPLTHTHTHTVPYVCTRIVFSLHVYPLWLSPCHPLSCCDLGKCLICVHSLYIRTFAEDITSKGAFVSFRTNVNKQKRPWDFCFPVDYILFYTCAWERAHTNDIYFSDGFTSWTVETPNTSFLWFSVQLKCCTLFGRAADKTCILYFSRWPTSHEERNSNMQVVHICTKYSHSETSL